MGCLRIYLFCFLVHRHTKSSKVVIVGSMVTNIQSSLAQAWRPRLVLATALLALHMVLAIPVADSSSKSCHCMPTDPCWPSTSEWNKLNSSVEGRLVQTHPIGSPCHDPTYDAAKCQFLQQQWTTPELQ